MAKNFLVGIGGSGARIAEAAMFLCASGYGPNKLFLFLIDPDKGNGNLGRTTRLLSKYLDCKKRFEKCNDMANLFKTELIVPKDEKDRVWGIFNKTDTTLAEWIGYDGLKETNKPEFDLMSILFSKDELSTKLNEGFRGHPAIGSVVMTEIPDNEYPFKLLWDELPDSKANDVRLFLVGSVFGGTGAAGFPTLGHRNTIKFNSAKNAVISEQESISRVLLGGALILPYFKVIKSNSVPGMYVSSNDFPIATKAALEFYDSKDSLGFDQIYFIGDSLSHSVGDFSVGSTSQENKPHYIEIVTTLASFDFFEQKEMEQKENVPMYFITRRDTEKVDWMSLPFSRTEEGDKGITALQNKFKAQITIMTVFCYALVTYGKSILNPEEDSKNKMEFKHPWYEHFNNNKSDDLVNPRTSENKKSMEVFIDFAEDYLEWISQVSDYSNVEMIDKTKITDGGRKWKNPVNLYLIGELLKEPSKKKGWADGFLQALNSEDINRNIEKNGKTISAANKLINLFYAGAQKFAVNNYTITLK